MNRQRLTEGVLLVIIAAIVFLLPNVIAFIKFNYFSSLLDIHTVATMSFNSDKPISAYPAFDGIVCSTTDQLSLYQLDGELSYQRQLFGKSPVVVAAAHTIVVADLVRGEVAQLDAALTVTAKARDLGQLRAVKLSDHGHVICQLQDENSLIILSDALSQMTRIDIPVGQIVTYDISSDQSRIMVSVVAVDDLALKSYVLQYDMTGQAIGTSDLEGDLVFANYLLDNQIIVTQSKIKSFNRESQKVAEIVNMEKIDQSTAYRNFIYTSYVDRDDEGLEQPLLSIYSDDLSYHQQLKLIALPSMIRVNDKFITTYAEGTIYVYDHSLRSLGSIRTQRNIVDMQWINASHLMAYDRQHVTIYALQ